MTDTLTVTKNEDTQRYEGSLDGEQVGFATYRLTDDAVELPHTVVDEKWGGRGFAGQIVKFALDDVRAQGRKVIPTCPYVAGYITKHPEYEDLRAG